MYIDTHSKETLIKTVLNILKTNEHDFKIFLNGISLKSNIGGIFDSCKFNIYLDNYIDERFDISELTEAQFYHLGRRLNSALNSNVGKNLKTLLLEDDNMKKFFAEHMISFFDTGSYIGINFKGQNIEFQEADDPCSYYIKRRLGYNTEADFCFNGFMFKDLLYENIYFQNLKDAPEFIINLAKFLNYSGLVDSYKSQSKYYCFEYLIPISNLIIDGTRNHLSTEEKAKYILKAAIGRINEYYTTDKRFMYDHNNLIFRLEDEDNLEEKYYIKKEEITNVTF